MPKSKVRQLPLVLAMLRSRNHWIHEIADATGNSNWQVYKVARLAGIEYCDRKRPPAQNKVHQLPRVLDMLRSRNYWIHEIAAATGNPRWQVYKVARLSGIDYRDRQCPPAKRKQIVHLVEIQGLPSRVAARRVGVSKSSADRVVQKRRRAITAAVDGHVRSFRTRTPKRCPEHGLVRIWPCVACAANTGT